ncbi:MAG: DUF3576 domain-containing protein [Alphaproteobacteria bacterium]|jgi:hypothetical protein|nr:MAG: DUF3576 domain-containing protein [Alphaproteobacteria bacterium]
MFSRVAAAAVLATALFGLGGCSIFGSSTANTSTASSSDVGPEENGALGVNAYLWRASLDTLSFLPLVSADPYGGVIITDWYANPDKKDERMKATVYILDTRLRADGVSAAVFRETLANGVWTTAAVSPDTNVALENAILAKARQLRLSSLQ